LSNFGLFLSSQKHALPRAFSLGILEMAAYVKICS